MQVDSIPSHLSFQVAAGQVAKSAHSRLSDILVVTGLQNDVDQSFDAINLAHNCLVALIVAGQFGQDPCSTGDNVDVVGPCSGEDAPCHLAANTKRVHVDVLWLVLIDRTS